jgi:hypothetical protein
MQLLQRKGPVCSGRAQAGRCNGPTPFAPVYRCQTGRSRVNCRAASWSASTDIVDEADATKLAELERRFRMADADG